MAQAQRSREPAEQYAQLVVRTWQDPAFKQRLVANPQAVIQEQGLPLPAGKTVRVVEDTPDTVHVVLPTRPARELSDEQLARLAGAGQGPARQAGQVLIQAWQDEAFKQRLMANPRAVLQEHGLPLPNSQTVQVVEDTADTVHLVLPLRPAEGELSDEQLERVAGGIEPLTILIGGLALHMVGTAVGVALTDWFED